MVSGGRRARQGLVGSGLPDRGELADRARLCRPRPRGRLAARAVAGDRGGRAIRRCPCCCRSSCWPPRRSISASTPNGPRASPARRRGPARGAAMTAIASPESLVLLAVLAPFVGALIIPLFHTLPNLRETVTLVDRRRCCASSRSACSGRCSTAPGRRSHVIEVAPGPRARLQGRAARHAVRARRLRRCGSSTRSTRSATCAPTTSRARPRSTSASRSRSAARSGIAFAKNLFTLFLFYEALTLSTYPLVTHKRGRRGDPRRPHLSPAPARHVARAVPAGDRRHLGARRHARFHARRHPGRQGRCARHRRCCLRSTCSASARRR